MIEKNGVEFTKTLMTIINKNRFLVEGVLEDVSNLNRLETYVQTLYKECAEVAGEHVVYLHVGESKFPLCYPITTHECERLLEDLIIRILSGVSWADIRKEYPTWLSKPFGNVPFQRITTGYITSCIQRYKADIGLTINQAYMFFGRSKSYVTARNSIITSGSLYPFAVFYLLNVYGPVKTKEIMDKWTSLSSEIPKELTGLVFTDEAYLPTLHKLICETIKTDLKISIS